MKKQRSSLVPLSQTDMARYLGVTSSQLSMTSSGRHGSRRLKDETSEKWARFIQLHLQQSVRKVNSPSLKKIKEQLATSCAKLAEKAGQVAAYHVHSREALTLQLEIMKEKEHAATGLVKTLDHLLATLPNNKAHAGDRLWAQLQLVKIIKAMKKYDFAAQVQLEARIAIEKAKAEINRDMERKLAGKKV